MDDTAVHFDSTGDDYALCQWRLFGETTTREWTLVTCGECRGDRETGATR